MDWMNYHHLYYFWVAAREGSITRASALLNVSQPAVSRQVQSREAPTWRDGAVALWRDPIAPFEQRLSSPPGYLLMPSRHAVRTS